VLPPFSQKLTHSGGQPAGRWRRPFGFKHCVPEFQWTAFRKRSITLENSREKILLTKMKPHWCLAIRRSEIALANALIV
jgi:hypothetical protein